MNKIFPAIKSDFYDMTGERIIGNNKVWFKGKCLTGKSYYSIIITGCLIFIPPLILYYILYNTIVFNRNYIVILYLITTTLLVICLIYLIKSSFTEPGIIKRNYKKSIVENMTTNYNKYSILHIKNGHLIKYIPCYTCNIIRPVRTSHCAECDNCTERFDHHCIWIGQCVGKRNYSYFLLFLIFLNSNSIFHIVINSIIISKEVENLNNLLELNSTSISNALIEETIFLTKKIIGITSFLIIYCTCFSLFFILKLCISHLFYAFNNITFYENLKGKYLFFKKSIFFRQSYFYNFWYLIKIKIPKSSFSYENIVYFENEKHIEERDEKIKLQNDDNSEKKNFKNESIFGNSLK